VQILSISNSERIQINHRLILTVFAEDQRMNAAVLFRGKGRVGVGEQLQHTKGIHGMVTSKAVINGPTMESHVKKFLYKVKQLHKFLDLKLSSSGLRQESEVTSSGFGKFSYKTAHTSVFA
jgi:hypothetical protein